MTTYRTVEVDGVEVFYREAGPADAPTILLHGFPSSSRMWEPLPSRLGDSFHLVAPDYPGFGHSDTPDPADFAYTFDHLAEVLRQIRVSRQGITLTMATSGPAPSWNSPTRMAGSLARDIRTKRSRIGGGSGYTHRSFCPDAVRP